MILQCCMFAITLRMLPAQSAGGVFVSLPEIEEVENADINQRLLEVIEQIGSYSKQIRSAIEDGVVEPHEQTAINDELYLSISKLREHAALVYKIFCVPERVTPASVQPGRRGVLCLWRN